mmetsp:Transcript_4698/g.9235  ORF Transcript_4698/g.9235 Transcript_4698/m.9235 type:complete len:96 (+) Transcript_4698:163-450(+)
MTPYLQPEVQERSNKQKKRKKCLVQHIQANEQDATFNPREDATTESCQSPQLMGFHMRSINISSMAVLLHDCQGAQEQHPMGPRRAKHSCIGPGT